MVPQNLITALPIWDSRDKQTFRNAQFNTGIGLVECRYDRMLPWIIKQAASVPTYVYLVAENDLTALDITSLMSMLTDTWNGNGYAYFEGSVDINQASAVTDYRWIAGAWSANTSKTWAQFVTPGSNYYLEFSFGGVKFYSELMKISDFPEFSDDASGGCAGSPRTRIEGTNACNIGDLPPTLSAQKLFVDAPTSEPEYVIEKDVAKDGQDEESPVWVKYKKRYKIVIYTTESVADWLASLPLYGASVNVADQYGYQSAVTDIEVGVTWPEDFSGMVALVEFSYSITYLSQTGCC